MPNQERQRHIEIRSDEVQEILSFIPGWIIRWGITAIFFTFFVLLIISWIVKYPDIISAGVVVTTENPPVRLVAQSSGKLRLLVKEKDPVEPDAVLAYIENPADYNDVLFLEKALIKTEKQFSDKNFIDNIKNTPLSSGLIEIDQKKSLILGELQNAFESCINTINDLSIFYNFAQPQQRIDNLEKQITEYQRLNQNYYSKRNLLSRELEISEKRFDIDSSLYKEKVIAPVELNDTEKSVLQQKRVLKDAEASIINNNIRITELRNQIREIRLEFSEKEQRLIRLFKQALESLKSQLLAWKQKYLLIAPITGKVTFLGYWSDNQFIRPNQEVIAVVPDEDQLIAKLSLPVTGSGKVKVGQEVNIKFMNYPHEEFGMIKGKVSAISLVAQQDAEGNALYNIDVSLEKGLTTTYKKELEFQPEMQGTADIITKDLRLIERIFNQFKKLFDQ